MDFKHPAQVIPIAGTVNVARIQLDESGRIRIRQEDWFAIWT
jgi:predicted oxidoreductase